MRISRLTLSALALLLVSAAFLVPAAAASVPLPNDPEGIADCFPVEEGLEEELPFEDEEPIEEEPVDEEPLKEEPVEE